MSHALTKPVFAICKQQRCASDCIGLINNHSLFQWKENLNVLQVLVSEAENVLGDQEGDADDIVDLIDQLSGSSDSDPELDVISVMSTPKPRLR